VHVATRNARRRALLIQRTSRRAIRPENSATCWLVGTIIGAGLSFCPTACPTCWSRQSATMSVDGDGAPVVCTATRGAIDCRRAALVSAARARTRNIVFGVSAARACAAHPMSPALGGGSPRAHLRLRGLWSGSGFPVR
jgi:hypothetical protein